MTHFIYNGLPQPQYKIPTTRGKFKVFKDDGELDFICEAISGGGGKGALPSGEYLAKDFNLTDDPAMSRYGIGFFIQLEPQFETDRTDLLIHLDGGKLGGLGCICLLPQDAPTNIDEAGRVMNRLGNIMVASPYGVRLTVA
ncbi:hypothetical protein NO1_1288 [Candidatus Termititenax aidoneus]|uniref:DUF5675 domain-containing protein n=1 Tax=Termititenax aidoneus TaxID=2218524 RepID=A0A388TB95_TERA1|nr:hypothetical protein NO1_1288 [Candidatus Termititenax aidoneus]